MYRTRLRVCPSCDGRMRKVPLKSMRGSEGGVDACDVCGGVFLEFFDGEPVAMAREVVKRLTDFDSTFRVGGKPLLCPDCNRPMDVYPYVDIGPDLARCHQCMAVFASVAQIRALARFTMPQNRPTLWSRLAALLRF